MGAFTTTAKNAMLNALTVNRIQLHSGNPGPNGDQNVISGTMKPATFGAASGGVRQLTEDVNYTGLTPNQEITYLTAWDYNNGNPIYQWSSAISGDTRANASGEYKIKAGDTKMELVDST